VVDYSVLVGVDFERNELVVGIIDYMRQVVHSLSLSLSPTCARCGG
jgi:hypothetical protein